MTVYISSFPSFVPFAVVFATAISHGAIPVRGLTGRSA